MSALPLDSHVHSEWSWDAGEGDLVATCARAVQIGLGALAFTEHVDFTRWSLVRPGPAEERGSVQDGGFQPEPLDVEGYLAAVDDCRRKFPGLRLLTGVELGEPHRHPGKVSAVLSAGPFDRVLGSLHSLPDLDRPGCWVEVGDAYRQRPAGEVVVAYASGLLDLVAADPPVAVLAHLDYPFRYWPAGAGPLRVEDFEEHLRAVLSALAGTGRALEVNTRLPLAPVVVDWWHQAGGEAVTFGSDAHRPDRLAARFAETAEMVAGHGYRPDGHPGGMWRRARVARGPR